MLLRPMPARFALFVFALMLPGCSSAPDRATIPPQQTSDAADPAALQILAASVRAMGGAEAVDSILSIDAVSDGTGPGGSFQTHVSSSRDGRMRFMQITPGGHFAAGIDSAGSWHAIGDSTATLDSATRSFLRGHELHMLALAPTTRWRPVAATGPVTVQNREAIGIRFTDEMGSEATIFYRPTDTLPLGYRLLDHSSPGAPPVEVLFGHWGVHGGPPLFTDAIFAQGEEKVNWHYTRVGVNTAPDSLFRRPRP
jgi:hypothetical protein